MNIQKSLLILLIVVILTANSFASIGGQSGAFLRNGVGSRALALGNAYTSLANDASAIYWNPAGLSEISQREFLGMFSIMTLDRQQLFASFANHFENIGTFGVGWLRFGVKDIDGRDASGNPTEKFDDAENAFIISYSRQFDFISVGISGKYIYHSLYNYSASGLGFDIGAQISIAQQMVRLGVVVQDVAGSLTWTTQSSLKETIPTTIRFGAAYLPPFLPAIVTVEGKKVTNEDFTPMAGIEYSIIEQFGVRGGYDGDNPSFGAFVKASADVFTAHIDYAATRDILQNSYFHHVTLRLGF